MLIDPEKIRILIIFITATSLASTEIEALETIARNRICYIIRRDEADTIPLKSIRETIIWNFQFPNAALQSYIMKKEHSSIEELAYISDDLDFLKNARELMGSSVYIKWRKPLVYSEAIGFLPDLVCNTISSLSRRMDSHATAFLGESIFSATIPDLKKNGLLALSAFNGKQKPFIIALAGRYFGRNKHYLASIDKYSQALVCNKNEGSRLYGKFNRIFLHIYHTMISSYIHQFGKKINTITNVPDKPTKKPRFNEIVETLCTDLGMENISADFRYVGKAIDNKTLSSSDRARNAENSYSYQGKSLQGKTVALIDDIATTGSTLAACVDELIRNGADEVICFVLAVNQFGCDSCFSRIFEEFRKNHILHFNAGTLAPFFSCSGRTEGFESGIQGLLGNINNAYIAMDTKAEEDYLF